MNRNYVIDELEKLQQCAIEGDLEARELWAMAVQYGDSVWGGFGGACYWYQPASEPGLPMSTGEPGKLYLVRQVGVKQDIENCLSLLIPVVLEGDVGDFTNMSLSSLYGPGMEINPENAVSIAQKLLGGVS